MKLRALQELVDGGRTVKPGETFEVEDHAGDALVKTGKAEAEGGDGKLSKQSAAADLSAPSDEQKKTETPKEEPRQSRPVQPMTTENSGLMPPERIRGENER